MSPISRVGWGLIVVASTSVVLLGDGLLAEEPHLRFAGQQVTPHVTAPALRYRRPFQRELSARYQLFFENVSPQPVEIDAWTFGDRSGRDAVSAGDLAWWGLPASTDATPATVSPGALYALAFNAARPEFGVGGTGRVGCRVEGSIESFTFAGDRDPVELTAVTWIDDDQSLGPERLILHLTNQTETNWSLSEVQLFVPPDPQHWYVLEPWGEPLRVVRVADEGCLRPGGRGVGHWDCAGIPLGYAVVRVTLQSDAGSTHQAWHWGRVKSERFDISGGWVQGETRAGPALQQEIFLQTLKRLYVNTAQIDQIPGYTDDSGPEGLYTRYPLKYFNRCGDAAVYDTDEVLPRIHAVEFLGEPQYGGRAGPMPPQAVFDQLAPYAPTRLPTSVTLSDERTWHHYAGLSDFPHFDCYRITAPATDAFSRYDRWEKSIRWGAPLETIGDLCRALRDMSRPGPMAYWSQGPHHDWGGFWGRGRHTPTPDEIRLQAYHALSSRITSLYWFNLSLKSLLKFPDTLPTLNQIGREIRLLEPFYLEGDAYTYRRVLEKGEPSWDLAGIATLDETLWFALDLDYAPGEATQVFEFGQPRPVAFEFPIPSFQSPPRAVFRVDHAGVTAVDFEFQAEQVTIRDRVSRVAIYVGTSDPQWGDAFEQRRQALLAREAAIGFDPIANPADFKRLEALLADESP